MAGERAAGGTGQPSLDVDLDEELRRAVGTVDGERDGRAAAVITITYGSPGQEVLLACGPWTGCGTLVRRLGYECASRRSRPEYLLNLQIRGGDPLSSGTRNGRIAGSR